MTLPNPKLGSDQPHLLTTHELLASALYTTAMGYYERGQDDLAEISIDRAVRLVAKLQSSHLKTEILGAAAMIHAETASKSLGQQAVFSYLHRAVQIHAASQSQDDAPDDNFFFCSKSMLYIYKAEALSAPKMKGATHETVRDILEDAQRLADPLWIRRQVIIEVLQARFHFTQGDYQQATEVVLSALAKSKRIHSRLHRNRLAYLYEQLLDTSFRNKPLLAYLGMKLRTWDHEMP